MSLFRLIARLDIKGENVVKGIQCEGLRVVGKPADMARRYAEAGADELYYLDTVASLYGRNQLAGLLEATTEDVFIPVTVGGGVRSIADIRALLQAGADKVAINTAALHNPALIDEASDTVGAQAVVVAIDAKARSGRWEAQAEGGRQPTGRDAVQWALEAAQRGAGELIVTSIDRDGTRRGFDVDLIRAIAPNVGIPVVAAGGMGNISHLQAVVTEGRADAVAVASALHYGKLPSLLEVRQAAMAGRKLPVHGGDNRMVAGSPG